MRHFCLATCWTRQRACLPTLAQVDMTSPQKGRAPLAAEAVAEPCFMALGPGHIGSQQLHVDHMCAPTDPPLNDPNYSYSLVFSHIA